MKGSVTNLTTRSITKNKLVEMLKGVHGSTFVGLVTRTDPKMRVTNNPYKDLGIKKVRHISGIVNFKYEDGVNRRLEKEGKEADFVAKDNWHEPVIVDGKLTPLCKHKTKDDYYIRISERNSKSFFVDSKGNEVAKSLLDPWLPKVSSYNGQGLDNPLEFKTLGLDSIESIQINNETLIVV